MSPGRVPRLLYKYPAEPGDTYTLPPASAEAHFGPTSITVTVVSTDAAVDTPTGPRTAYHYRIEIPEFRVEQQVYTVTGLTLDRYLVPEVGFQSLNTFYLTVNRERTAMEPISGWEWTLAAVELP